MNITGYKNHKKVMQQMSKDEQNKPEKRKRKYKIESLTASILECNSTIKDLQKKYKISQDHKHKRK